MNLLETRAAARHSLAAADYNGKTLALLHTGVALLLSLLMTAANLLLSQSVENTVGLSGIGTRSVLQAIQSFLSLVSSAALPFWQMGFVYACIRYARGQSVQPGILLEGFRRFGPILRLFFLQALIYIGAGIACLYIAGTLFSFTPFVHRLYEVMEPVLQGGVTEELLSDPNFAAQFLRAATPLYILAGILLVLVITFLFYRLRMAQFAIMDDAPGALAAIAISFRMMRKKCLCLFRVDLRFWWFFALKLLIAIVAYADILLALLGIYLPISETALFFGTYGLYALLELLLNWQCSAYLQTTYAHCYQMLKDNMPQPKMLPEA